jgi:hypothetical protein
MESENIENIDEVVQEGGQVTGLLYSDNVNFARSGTPSYRNLQSLYTSATRWDSNARNFRLNGIDIIDRPLFLSDLALLMNTIPTFIGGPLGSALTGTALDTRKDFIRNLFDNIPLAQYKHLPDPLYLSATPLVGGSTEESTLATQEVSLPPSEEVSLPNEEVLPSLDIIEPTSVGGSYKRSSHKKRKSTRTRTKKNKL